MKRNTQNNRSERWLFDYQETKNLNFWDINFLMAGTDEAGRGALAGPIVVAAVVLHPDYDNHSIRDSKKLTIKERDKLYDEIVDNALSYAISILDHDVVDQINPKAASRLGMIQCFKALFPQPQLGLIDAENLPEQAFPTKAFIKGDDKSLHIAAASILAKVTRDRLMLNYHELYPAFHFDKNKGYGTAEHMHSLETQGVCPIHRKSYRPVRDLLANQASFNFNEDQN